MRLLAWTGFWVLLVDQISKYFVVEYLDLGSRHFIPVWPPLLTFRMAWNKGVNFGLFGDMDMRWVLIGMAVLIGGLVLYWMRSETKNKKAMISAGLLIGGAIGNVIDRLHYNAVADFLNMSCCGFDNPYSFNIADIAIFAGAIGLVLFTSDKPKKSK